MSEQCCFFEKKFHLSENKTSVKQEFLAGLTTFLAMAYILAVNPSILSNTGMPSQGVFVATALASVFGTLAMAFLSNYPFALAPGMGINAYFAYTVVLGMGYSWQFALLAVFVEGVIFLLLSLTNVREAIFNSIPLTLKRAGSVGIGLFIAFIGMQGAHIVVGNQATLLSLQSFSKVNIHTYGMCAILALLGTLITAWLMFKRVRGSILLGIFITWFLGILAQLTGLYIVTPEKGCYSLLPSLNFSTIAESFRSFGGLFGTCLNPSGWTLKGYPKVGFSLVTSINFFVIMFSFMFVDIFETLGTLIGVASKANMLSEDGKLKNIRGALLSDSAATIVGALLGTSTTTTYVESAAGIAEGGRTGLTSVFTAIFFILALVFAPIFLAIPAFATAPALIIVGFFMLSNITKIDFDNIRDAIPSYITILIMPFGYSIAEGICAGIISWTILNFFSDRRSQIKPLMYILSIIFLLKYIAL